MNTHSRAQIQNIKGQIKAAKDSPGTPKENQMDQWRWQARTDEDLREGVQGLLLLILERHGTCLLNLAAGASRAAKFSIALRLQERHLAQVKVSRILAAMRRWERGPENVRAMNALGAALGEIKPYRASVVALRSAV